ncbi:MAG TPA: type II secretion system protein GspG [Pyrinomonadaceae bacterium]|nr:type II secretion system protein GspG [Pyrinomonadaceae bacterium]
MSKPVRFLSTTLIFLTLLIPRAFSEAHASTSLSSKQAREVIRHVGGSDLSKGSVKVRGVQPASDGGADVLAQLKLAFRMIRDDHDGWHVEEVRTGDRRWEEVAMIVNAVYGGRLLLSDAGQESGFSGFNATSELSPERARRLIADLLEVQLPSDAVRVNAVSALGNSALVETEIELEFHLVREGNTWRVQKSRTAGNNWQDVDAILGSINQQKIARARDEMQQIVRALEVFRSERGFYVDAMNEGALVDHLSPQYLNRVIRFDPWNRLYQYEGTRGHFTLRSLGADGKPQTADDIVMSGGS